MADVPTYQPSIPIQDPGVPQVRVEPFAASAAPTNVAEALGEVGKSVEQIGSHLATHMIMQQKLREQQDDYAVKDAYKSAVQNAIADPENGLLSRYQGVNSPKALAEFDQIRSGKPAAPGQPGIPAIRDQFLSNKSPYQRSRLEKDFDAIDSMYRGKLINHVLEQTEAASKAINEANIDSHLKDGALVTPTAVNDPATGKLIPSITLAENKMRDTIQNDIYFKKQGHAPEVIHSLVQKNIDQLAKNAVEANVAKSWEAAQQIKDSSTASPEAKVGLQKIIDGARIDQYADALASDIVRNPALRQPDGQVDELKAQDLADKKIGAEETGPSPLPPGHADALMGKVQAQISIHNRAISQHQQLVMNETASSIWDAARNKMAPADAYDKFIKQGQFDNGIERAKAEEVFTKVYEKDPSALDTVWSHMGETQKNTISQITGSADFKKKFPYANDAKAFEDVLKQKVLEGHIQSPDAINQLFQEQLKVVPSGAPRFLGFGKQQLPTYKIDESLQKNQPLIKAVGGLSAAAKLANDLGGPEKLAPDTNESKAVAYLAANGGRIDAAQVKKMIANHADLLK